MPQSKLAVTALVCALMVAVPAGAVEYFFDDFNDGDMTSDWTDLEKEIRAKKVVRYGSYGYAAMGQSDTADDQVARATKPLSVTTLADTVYFSFDAIHTGGYKDSGSMGWKTDRIYLVNDSGEGYGIYLGYAKSTQTGQFGIITTTDFGVTEGSAGPGSEIVLPPGLWDADNFSEHEFGFAWDRVNAYIDMYFDGTYVNTVLLDLTQNDTFKNPTKVLSNPLQLLWTNNPNPDDPWDYAGPMTTDDIWFGDQVNPNAPDPILAQGDSDGNLKVDIVDLTAVAANWSTLSPGNKDWTQGDFNYDWLVDIIDLTALAANWSFAGSPPPVPEPLTLSLLGLGGAMLLRRRR